ncbi:hypothetical protein AZE42_02681 [Rhizopogon vesiculosus]|uniref:Uncharacterized protein n=1 Tax=Rhizopogon vesiculosus TaxID=180088 RepID=A0A1J8QH52_9AGAM|nr:hypothetical protein AZE42_02681 [Rhizopogon vesiculosus]
MNVIAGSIPHALLNSLELTLLAPLLKLLECDQPTPSLYTEFTRFSPNIIHPLAQVYAPVHGFTATWTRVIVFLSPTSSPASTINNFTAMVNDITSQHPVLTRSFHNDLAKRVGYTQINELVTCITIHYPLVHADSLVHSGHATTAGLVFLNMLYLVLTLFGKSDLIKVYSHNVLQRNAKSCMIYVAPTWE